MINCPKCNELIGDKITKCAFCKHELTTDELRKALDENENFHRYLSSFEENSGSDREFYLINCPGCNELIGERVKKCPFCKHEITPQELNEAREKIEAIHTEARIKEEQNAIREFTKRHIIGTVLDIITTVLIICLIGVHLETDVDDITLWIAFIVVYGSWKILMYKLKADRCPYCDCVVDLSPDSDDCPNCGRRLR